MTVPAQQPLADPPAAAWIPPVPDSVADTGLTPEFISDLLLKILYVQGARSGQQLSDQIALPFALIDDMLLDMQGRRFIEVRSTHGPNRGGYLFDLVGAGRERARDALESNQYVGPAPVPLNQYRAAVLRQSIANTSVTLSTIRGGFSHLVLEDAIVEALGPAINSAKSLFLFGDPGNGKTTIAEAIARMLGGTMYVPYAVDIDGETMVLADPVYHEPVDGEGFGRGEAASVSLWLKEGTLHDRRYLHVERPVVLTGGELTLDQLDLQYDPFTKIYQAPFQVKANGGVLIVDDFGRQRVPARDLLNRWIVPLEKRMDFLTLHTGGKFPVPFDCLLIFATNIEPRQLAEEAFLRRIHYKIHIPSPTPDQYVGIFEAVCQARGLGFKGEAVGYVYQEYYGRRGIPARGCHPRDIIDHLFDIAKFLERDAELSIDLIDRACRSYFLDPSDDSIHLQT